jgi:mono/diheme cytochrome c family protein
VKIVRRTSPDHPFQRIRTAAAAAVAVFIGCHPASAQTAVERGRYLVAIGGCNDCHTPGYFVGKPDTKRFLAGSDIGFFVPKIGSFVGPNLTSDKETGLGNWTQDDIVTALQTGVRPDGRELSPVMPWRAFAEMDKSDAYNIATYLKSLPAVKNKVSGPFGPDEDLPIAVLKVVPPGDPR